MLVLVKGMERSIDEIWKRLKRALGNPEILLHNKLCETEKCDPIWTIREPKRLIKLSNLAEKHLMENDFYHNTTINLIYDLVGEFRK